MKFKTKVEQRWKLYKVGDYKEVHGFWLRVNANIEVLQSRRSIFGIPLTHWEDVLNEVGAPRSRDVMEGL